MYITLQIIYFKFAINIYIHRRVRIFKIICLIITAPNYLQRSVPAKVRAFDSFIPSEIFTKMSLRLRIASVVFSFRGDFGYINKAQFKEAMKKNDMAGAKQIILKSTEYRNKYKCHPTKTNRNGVCERIEWVADIFGNEGKSDGTFTF